ncbi:hypothetical protein Vadar_032415 [Vaccinium darrowii]|uniref:Uncharacterized protein n=1 Tax=Vaccinium darrowii TaxID=229202 RepID=A0ACB7XWE4_9ERIC|nr:hypothetical protein Vadar_032415 [Vaccinium darrowii]
MGNYWTLVENQKTKKKNSYDKAAGNMMVVDINEWSVIDPLPSYGRERDAVGGRYISLIFGTNLTDVVIAGDNGTSTAKVNYGGSMSTRRMGIGCFGAGYGNGNRVCVFGAGNGNGDKRIVEIRKVDKQLTLL